MIPGLQLLDRIHESPRTLVWRARDAAGLPVVVKTTSADRPRPDRIARYRREHEIASRLAGDHVVRPIAFEVVRGRPFLVFEDIGGVALSGAAPAGSFPLAELLAIAIAIAEGIGEIHAGDVIHKDINPSNVVYDRATGRLVVIDFGISTVLSRESPVLKSPEVMEGTLRYISPEQTGRMNRVLDHRSDFYSLGVTLYELFAGAPPFTGDDALELLHRHLTQAPAPLHEVDPRIPRPLSEIVAKLLAKTAEDRYESARGIVADLARCAAAIRDAGRVDPFPLGRRDVPRRLHLPQRLYGRENEVSALRAALDRVAAGGREIVLVTGYSGIGKTSLVRELFEPLTRQRGRFICGKFDQLERDVPYSALVKASQDLVRQILTESEAQLAEHRARLADALGASGGVIVDVIPEVELILGPQPPLPALPPPEAETRLNQAFASFIRVFCEEDHPLVIFLDDLQWVDAATLKLLGSLMADDEARHCLFIGAYRDNEVGADHPLSVGVAALAERGAAVRTIALAPLRLDQLVELCADTARCDPMTAMPLAELLLGKTGGNPFFVAQFLGTLWQEGLIRFDPEGDADRPPGWRWDIARIEEVGLTDNVVDLMLGRLKRLPGATIDVVRLAACLGDAFDLRSLATIHRQPARVTHERLFPAILEGIVVPTSDLEILDREDVDAPLVFPRCKFLHDRVQQAAYASIDPARRPGLHLRIGRNLLAGVEDPARSPRLFEIVDHLNLGRALIEAREERIALSRLDLAAARRAKCAAAYGAARRYLDHATAAFPGDWDREHALTLSLRMERAEVEYLNGDYARSEAIIEEVWQRARIARERAEAYALLVTQRTMLGQNDEAIEAAAQALGLLGIGFPAADALGPAIDAELAGIEGALRGRPIASLLDLPPMTDPDTTAAMKVLMTVHTAVYFADRYDLYAWVLARMVNLSIRHGNVPEASKGYASFGNTLAANLGRYEDGYQFGVLGLDLARRYEHQGLSCKACLILSMFLNHWVRPVAEADRFDEEGIAAGLAAGELQFVGYLMAYGRTLNHLHRGDGLGRLLAETEAHLAFTRKAQNKLATDLIIGARIVVANLAGRTRSAVSFDTESTTEAAYLAAAAHDQSAAALCFYRTMKALALYVAGEGEAALAQIEEARPLIGTIRGVLTEAVHAFYHALIVARSCADADRAGAIARIDADLRALRTWADHCPANFRHQVLLVEAERARVSGEVERAMVRYDEAIAAAADDGPVHHEALANELAARFWISRQKPDFALIYLRRARACYRAWGAARKVTALAAELDRISEGAAPAEDPAGDAPIGDRAIAITDTTSMTSLDLASVLKASQAISSEMVLDDLLDRLLRVVIESAGAERCAVILRRDGRLRAAASITAADGRATILDTPIEAADLPVGLVQYVARTRRSVVLADAAREGMFTEDPRVKSARTRSVLSVPILCGGELGGVLYLENDQIAGAFSADRVELLRILSAQAAISLENASLLAREREARAAAEEAERRAAFFAETSKVLTASLDWEEVLRRLAALAVERLADWCVIDGLEGDRLRRLAGDHVDPSRRPALDELRRRYPPRPGSAHLAVRVAREGASVIHPEVTDEILRQIAEDEDHRRLLRDLGVRALLAVPIVTRGRMLGVLTLGSAAPGRRYGRADLEMAEEVGRRAAVAIDNAQLFQQTQRSVRMRDEFLMVASHELRSPLTPLKLQNQIIRRHMDSVSTDGLPGRAALRTAIDRSLDQIDGLVQLSDNLLDVSRIAEGRLVLHRDRQDLAEIVRDAVDRHAAACRMAGCALTIDAPSPVPGCWDRARVDQVVSNLLRNAMKYGAGKPVEVSVAGGGGRAEIAVRDHGIGIAKEEQRRLFERFGRAAPAAHYGGLGLGLYITREIVAAHGGTIRVDSEVGQGSIFRVDLPTGDAPS